VTANAKIARFAFAGLLGILIPLGIVGVFFPDPIGLIKMAVLCLATGGPIVAARLVWEHRCHSAGLSLMPLESSRRALVGPVALGTLSIVPLIMFMSHLSGWPGPLAGALGLATYAALQWFTVTRAWRAYHAEFLAKRSGASLTQPAA
jgi:hypothetical protein